MAKTLYFNGTIELEPSSIRHDGRKFVGNPVGYVSTFEAGKGWSRADLHADRIVNYKSNPSRHECDARCMNASGRTMNCECACGGKNHGKGRFNCTSEAA